MTKTPATLACETEAAIAKLTLLATADPANLLPIPLLDLGKDRSRMLSIAQVQRLFRDVMTRRDRLILEIIGPDLRLILADRQRMADELALAYGRVADEAATTQAETTEADSCAAAAAETPPDLPLPDDAIGRCSQCRIPLGVNAGGALLPGIVTPAGLRCPVCLGIVSAEELRANLDHEAEATVPTQNGATSE